MSMQKFMYSQYKGRATVKVLLGIVPGEWWFYFCTASDQLRDCHELWNIKSCILYIYDCMRKMILSYGRSSVYNSRFG